MAEAKRRGYGEDGIYFDHRADCKDGAQHKTCAGRWRGVVSLGFSADGKRIRKKVSGKTRTEVKEKLKELHSELDAGVRTVQRYTVTDAVADWLAEGLPGRAAKTIEVNRDALRPVLDVIGTIPLRDLSAHDVRTALSKMAATHATRTLQKAHNCKNTAWYSPPPSGRRMSRITCAEISAGSPRPPESVRGGCRRSCGPRS
jgi:hypothetical protein